VVFDPPNSAGLTAAFGGSEHQINGVLFGVVRPYSVSADVPDGLANSASVVLPCWCDKINASSIAGIAQLNFSESHIALSVGYEDVIGLDIFRELGFPNVRQIATLST
jgi:hypothetical protein